MKLTFRTMLATVALAITALGSTANAQADAYLSIGTSTYTAPYASGGSVEIVDHCNNKRWYSFGAYRVYGAYCSVHYSYYQLATYWFWDDWNRAWALDCWSTPVQFLYCTWR